MEQAALLVERARAERGEGVEAFMYVARHLASLLLLVDPPPPDPVRKSQRVKPARPARAPKTAPSKAPAEPVIERKMADPPVLKRAETAAPADVTAPPKPGVDERARDKAAPSPAPTTVAVEALVAKAVVRVELLGTHGTVHYRDRAVKIAPRAAQLLQALAAAMPKPVDPHWLVKKLTWPTGVKGNVEIVHDIARNAGELVAPIGLRVLRIQGVGISLQEGT